MKPPLAGQDFDLDAYGPVDAVAAVLGRPGRTIRTWIRAGAVRHQILGAVLLVHVLDVARESGTRGRRARCLTERQPSP